MFKKEGWGNNFGGNDLKEEGVMDEEWRLEKGKLNFERCGLNCWFSLFSRTVGDPTRTICRLIHVCPVSAVTYTGTT